PEHRRRRGARNPGPARTCRGTPRIGGLRVGFVSTNGYILAFRRYFGETPGAYVKRSASRTAA
ncbi:hypothetical protein AB0G92_34580, partial [Streptomyces californicus]